MVHNYVESGYEGLRKRGYLVAAQAAGICTGVSN